MRAKGAPARSRESTDADLLATARRGAPASDRVDRDHDPDPAEPRDRASYATDMRVNPADPRADRGSSRQDQDMPAVLTKDGTQWAELAALLAEARALANRALAERDHRTTDQPRSAAHHPAATDRSVTGRIW